MATAFALWLNQLLSGSSAALPSPASAELKPLQIEVDRLPDYLWRDLGFQQTRRPEGE